MNAAESIEAPWVAFIVARRDAQGNTYQVPPMFVGQVNETDAFVFGLDGTRKVYPAFLVQDVAYRLWTGSKGSPTAYRKSVLHWIATLPSFRAPTNNRAKVGDTLRP